MSPSSPPPPLRLGVLVSGNGSNLQAILDACRSGAIRGQVAVVVSNKPGVKALERAQRAAGLRGGSRALPALGSGLMMAHPETAPSGQCSTPNRRRSGGPKK